MIDSEKTWKTTYGDNSKKMFFESLSKLEDDNVTTLLPLYP